MRHASIFRGPGTGLVALLFAAIASFALPRIAAAASDPDDIRVAAFKGEVQIVSAGAGIAPSVGAVLALPGSVQTGVDGTIDLQQGETKIAVGPGTRLDFPAPEAAGPLGRVAQHTGNAYYDVGPRGSRKLRVETPFLVAVIKGTQFNVAVTADSATVSLHEGRLEILATEDGVAPVLLNAGEVAVRRKDEREIRVLKTAGTTAAGGSGSGGGALPLGIDDGGPGGGMDPGGDSAPVAGDDSGSGFGGSDRSPLLPTDGGAGAGVDLDLGDSGVTVNAGVDIGAGEVAASAGADLDLGAAEASASAEVGLDLGAGTVDAGADVGVDVGAVSADTGLDAGVDLGAGTVDAGVDIGADAGAVSADVGIDAGADLGAGSVDAGVDAGAAGVEAGVDVGVDLTGGDAGVDVGIDVLGTEIDVGLGGGNEPAEPPDAPGGGNPGGGLGGILGGLLGGP
jgi:hypothetical protein